MQIKDQQKIIDELKKYEKNFSSKEAEEFKMFIKRQKDDEDFDTLSYKRLKDLHAKYYKPADRSKLEALFKKKDDQ